MSGLPCLRKPIVMKFFLTSNLKRLMLPFIFSVPSIVRKNSWSASSFFFSPLGLSHPFNPNTFNLSP